MNDDEPLPEYREDVESSIAPPQANPFGRRRDEAPSTQELLGKLGKKLPWSDDAEKGVLSCLFQSADLLMPEARRKLQEEAFHREAHRIIWLTMLKMHDSNRPLDPHLLTDELRAQGKLDICGGPAEVMEIYGFIPLRAHWPHYLQLVLDNWILRRTMHTVAVIGNDIQSFGSDGEDRDVTAFVTAAESKMFSLVEEVQALGESREGIVSATQGVAQWMDHMQQTIDNRGKIQGLTTGIHELDVTLHGLDDKEGEICVLAGRPAMGKTAMAGTIAEHLSVRCNVPGLIFSIEMSANQLFTRLVLGPAGIDTSKAVTGHFSRGDMDAMSLQVRLLQKSPLLISASAGCSTADIRAQAQLAKRRHGIRWIMVDHLHLVKSANPKQNVERERLVEVMDTLQFLKKDLNIVVFLLVQMSRETDRNPGKPPVLADLLGSGAIEQYADHVIFIHREDEYVKWHRLTEDKQNAWRDQIEPRRERSPELWSDGQLYDDDSGGFARQDYEEKAMLYVRKNRRGPTPELQVRYQKALTRFSTRMPKVTSTNPLDWQLGSYQSHTPPRRGSKKADFKPASYGRVEGMKGIPED